MDKRELTDLTNKVYKITLLFPKKDPLRYKIREKASDLLAGFVSLESLFSSNPGSFLKSERNEREILFSLEKDLSIIRSYFEVAKWQNWANYFEILELQEDYDKIKGALKEEIGKLKYEDNKGEELKKIEVSEEEEELGERKEEIVKILGKVNRIQVGKVAELMPNISKRTLRRDFQKLVEQGIAERTGSRNNTFYRLKNREVR